MALNQMNTFFFPTLWHELVYNQSRSPFPVITLRVSAAPAMRNGVRRANCKTRRKRLTGKPPRLHKTATSPPLSQAPANSDPRTSQQANIHPNPKSNALFDHHHRRLLRFLTSLSPRLPARRPDPPPPRPRDGGLRRPPRRARQVGRRRRRRGQVSGRSPSISLRASVVRCLPVLVWACACEVSDEMGGGGAPYCFVQRARGGVQAEEERRERDCVRSG